MPAVSGDQVKMMWAEGDADKAALFALRKITTADTIDLGAGGPGQFSVVKQAVMLGTTVSGTAACTVSGTTVTVPAGLSNDAA